MTPPHGPFSGHNGIVTSSSSSVPTPGTYNSRPRIDPPYLSPSSTYTSFEASVVDRRPCFARLPASTSCSCLPNPPNGNKAIAPKRTTCDHNPRSAERIQPSASHSGGMLSLQKAPASGHGHSRASGCGAKAAQGDASCKCNRHDFGPTAADPAKQLHPNGRRLIAIRDVKRVYKHPRAIPVRCYPFKTPGPQSKVTPEQVVAASTQHDAEPPSDPSDSSDSESGPGWSNQFDAEASDEYDEGLRELVREIDTAFGCVPQGGLWDQYDSD
ncbi:hypothetical protein BD626DRAFT_629688 [Schizophyllum amplum]|uniref:Uncharacterized protein n=1 Tax=Schizophyllum amplum TaxID=97359 RepID=A0A550CGK0_9AGAR|nr:hypothetical protein BD626DRAFT_629688 [Auriculariopsis ampla]